MIKVKFYADTTAAVWTAVYETRQAADNAVERAAELLGWIGIIVSDTSGKAA